MSHLRQIGDRIDSQPEELRERTKQFAYRVVRMFQALPRTPEAQVIGRQLLRSGTSVGANYRASCRARSRAEFVAKLGIVMEEIDESVFWLEMLSDLKMFSVAKLTPLIREANEIAAIIGASLRTARSRH